MAVNLLYVAYDARWFVALGGLVTTGVGLVVLTRIWRVFPFAFGPGFDWPLVMRVLLVLAIAGSAIALIVQPVQLLIGQAGARNGYAERPSRSG